MAVIRGTGGDDTLVGTGDSDVIDVYQGDDTVDGGDGNDIITKAGIVSPNITEFIYRTTGNATIFGGGGNDTIIVRTEGLVTIDAGSGNDLVGLYSLSSDNTVDLGDGDDAIFIFNSYLTNTLTLGAGRDTVIVQSAGDYGGLVIADFEAGASGDVIDLSVYIWRETFTTNPLADANPFASGHLLLVQDGADTLVRLDVDGAGGGSGASYEVTLLRLQDVFATSLTAVNFNGWDPGGADPVSGIVRGTAGDDMLFGLSTGGTLSAGGGNDRLFGSYGNDVLVGGAGNDTIDGGYGNDILQGGNGDDYLTDSYGNDSFDGGNGNDTIDILRTTTVPGNPNRRVESVAISGGTGNDSVSFDVTIGTYTTYRCWFTADLGDGDDVIRFADRYFSGTITLGAGTDRIEFGQEFFFGGPSINPSIVVTDFVAGAGGDVLDLTAVMSQMLPNVGNPFTAGYLRLVQDGNDTIVGYDSDGIDGNDDLVVFARLNGVAATSLTTANLAGYNPSGAAPVGMAVSGTPRADLLYGTTGDDRLSGGNGDDRLTGRNGDDILNGGNGNDIIDGGAGNDRLIGGNDDDRITDLDYGSDVILGGAGNDTIIVNHTYSYGTFENVTIDAGSGNDDVTFATGRDGTSTIQLGDGDDRLTLNSVSYSGMSVTTGAGSDVVVLSTQLQSQQRGELTITDFTAGDGGDRLEWLTYARNSLYLQPGDNPFALGLTQLVQSGSDVLLQFVQGTPQTIVRFANVQLSAFSNYNFAIDISALAPVDTLPGTSGDDTLNGSAINDLSHGLAGRDTISGGDGNDSLFGGADNDTLNGDGGNDILDGGEGIDRIFGGDGDDTITDLYGTDILNGGNGNDIFTVDDQYYAFTTVQQPNAGRILAGGGDDTIYLRDQWGGYSVNAGPGNDTVHVQEGIDDITLTLGSGSDTVQIAGPLLNGGKLLITDFAAGNGGDVFDAREAVERYTNLRPDYIESHDLFALGQLELRQAGADVELWFNPVGLPGGFNAIPIAVFQNSLLANFTAFNFLGDDPAAALTGAVQVRDAYTIAVGATESLTDPSSTYGYSMHYYGEGDFAFTNRGTAEVTRTSESAAPLGFYVNTESRVGHASFVNAGSGVFTVTDTMYAGGTAIGYQNGADNLVSFRNRGLMQVESLHGSAIGIISGYSSAPTINYGTLTVTAAFNAYGARIGYGDFTNSGTMNIHGGEFAVGVFADQWLGTLANSGTINVSTDPSSPYVSIGFLLNENVPAGNATSLSNSGMINADYAVYIRETSPSSHIAETFTNTGTVNGIVWLSDGDDIVINTGIMSSATLLGSDNDTYDGSGGRHDGTVEGGDGNDRLTGGGFADTFFGDAGSDLLVGNGGDDWLDGGFGSDLVDGGSGFDVLSYLEAAAPMLIDLGRGFASGGIDLDYFRNIEAVVASRGDDRVIGSDLDDVIFGMGGKDTLDGGNGHDVLVGGTGNDFITTGDGLDRVIFSQGDGRDVVRDFSGADIIEIYGYSSARSISQSGTDVKIVLSPGDIITLRDTTLAQLNSANLLFSTSAYPFTFFEPPSRTLSLTDDLIIGESAILSFTDTDPLIQRTYILDPQLVSYAVQLSGSSSPGLWNAGTILHETISDVATAVGVNGASTLVNHAGGLIEVVAHGSNAVGGSILGNVFNHGTLVVTSDHGNATGFEAVDGYGDFVNTGSITVTALAGTARGTDQLTTSTSPIHMFNIGSLAVSGHDASLGYDVRMFAHPLAEQPIFVNSGSITVTDQTAVKDSVALDVYAEARGQIWNSGTITADYAIKVTNSSYSQYNQPYIHLSNTGQINGAVELSHYDDIIVNQGDIIGAVFLGGGADVFDGRLGTLVGTLDGYDGDDTLLTGAGAQTILGGFGNDILSGGAGADTLTGGQGRDHFRFGSGFGHDLITDFAGGPAGDFIDVAGYAAALSIVQQGADVLVTFSATDSLSLRNATVADVTAALSFSIAEIAAWTLPATPTAPDAPAPSDLPVGPTQQFEALSGTSGNDTLTGSGADEQIVGLAGQDHLFGLGGADTLNGGPGNDIMEGGSGSDTYVVDSPGDSVIEQAGGGNDRVKSAVSWTLGDYVEQLIMTGSAEIDGTGNELANRLAGNSSDNRLFGLDGNDKISGGNGDDLLVGGAGADTLTGGNGADSFRFDQLETSAQRDLIRDFAHGVDHLEIDRSAFAAFNGSAAGTLDPAGFVLGTAATTADEHLIYDQATGSLYYDEDGSGDLAQVRIAILSSKPMIDASDFLLV